MVQDGFDLTYVKTEHFFLLYLLVTPHHGNAKLCEGPLYLVFPRDSNPGLSLRQAGALTTFNYAQNPKLDLTLPYLT
jgi:hypothetical protein